VRSVCVVFVLLGVWSVSPAGVYPCPEPDVMGNPAAGANPRQLVRRIN
jgi:hypothetical protein